MKEDKNVTDSVTSDVNDIASNLKELNKNTQKKDTKPDVYAEKLPVIIEELRMQNKQLVEEKDWYKYTALICVPLIGAIYMLLQGDEKNLNKRNFCLVAFKINLAYTAALIALCIALFFAGSYVGKTKAASNKVSARQETDVNDSQTETEYTQNSSQMITKNNMSDDTDMSKDYTYNSDKKTFAFILDGVSMTYPVTAGQLKSMDYTYMSQASQPHSQAIMTSYANSKSGTKVALTITLSDTSQDDIKCSEMQVNFSDNTEFLGLNKKSDVSKVKSVFSSSDKEDITDFNESTKTGSIVYSIETLKITVSIKNGAVSSVTIK